MRERVRIALARIRKGHSAKSVMLIGLRGVGKTVLLDRLRLDAEERGLYTTRSEAPEGRSLPAILAPELRTALLKLSRVERAKSLADRAMRGLAGFARGLKVKYGDLEVAIEGPKEPGLADNGDLETDLVSLIEAIGEATRAADTALVMFIDELQYVEEKQLAALITALHRVTQRELPVTLVGAGLPQLRGQVGEAKSYAERLFEFETLSALSDADARRALTEPAAEEGVSFEDQAMVNILEQTQGYPFFLQEWGKASWEQATTSPITARDVLNASPIAVSSLDASFFGVRFDRLTPKEKTYLRAMAKLGPGPHRSGDIADAMDRKVQSVAPLRNGLIHKGMIWSPSHGDTGFTVPLFDQFMRRIMPGESLRD